jgi:hypothetical protein
MPFVSLTGGSGTAGLNSIDCVMLVRLYSCVRQRLRGFKSGTVVCVLGRDKLRADLLGRE